MKYFFFPGRKWLLAQAELRAVLNKRNYPYVELASDEQVLLYDITASEKEVNDLFYSLGGSVKSGVIVDDPFQFLSHYVSDLSKAEAKKIRFSVSFINSDGGNAELQERNKLGMEIKKWLSNQGYSSRFVSNHTTAETSSVLIETNYVIEKGFEINRFSHPKSGKTLWGITGAIQDYEGFSKRDYSRPCSNKLKGMIPPKLARIMINLAQVPKGGCIWDPFCGSGTILMEALILGYKVVGTDIDPTSIEESTQNARWMCEEYWISHNNYSVFQHNIHDSLPPAILFDAIVTEPYLGPVALKTVSIEQVHSATCEISPLFHSLGAEIERQVIRDRHGTIVTVIPGFKSQKGWIDMDVSFADFASIRSTSQTKMSKPLQWDRPNSIIRRNISQFSF